MDAPDAERQAAEPDSGEVLSVSQLNDRITSVVEDAPALDGRPVRRYDGVRCIGEVTDFHQNSTTLYFMLTDDNAEISCMHRANCYRNMAIDLEMMSRP